MGRLGSVCVFRHIRFTSLAKCVTVLRLVSTGNVTNDDQHWRRHSAVDSDVGTVKVLDCGIGEIPPPDRGDKFRPPGLSIAGQSIS